MSDLRKMVKKTPQYQSGDWFRRQDIFGYVGAYHQRSYSRTFAQMVEFGELEKSSRRGYYRKASDHAELRDVIPDIDAGRITMKAASDKFPWHYHTFCKRVRQCRKGVGIFA